MPEMFVFTSSDGVVRFFSVDGSNITPNEIQVDLGPGVVSSLFCFPYFDSPSDLLSLLFVFQVNSYDLLIMEGIKFGVEE